MIACFCKTNDKRNVWALLDMACRKEFGRSAPRIKKLDCGKPVFVDDSRMFFSVSHTVGCVMAVIGSEPCGCDVERDRAVLDCVINRIAHEDELNDFEPLELWTLKESLFKLVGNAADDDACAFVKAYPFKRSNDVITCCYAEAMVCELHRADGFQMAVVSMRTDRRVDFEEVTVEALEMYKGSLYVG